MIDRPRSDRPKTANYADEKAFVKDGAIDQVNREFFEPRGMLLVPVWNVYKEYIMYFRIIKPDGPRIADGT